MKYSSNLTNQTSHATTINSSKKQDASAYATSDQCRALFERSLAYRQQQLHAENMMSTDEAANLVGTSRVTVNAWIAKGRAIGLTQAKRGFRLPRWQFEPSIWDVLPKLAAALGTTDGWALLTFMETPMGALQGLSPREALEKGSADQVLEIAALEGS